MADSWLDLFNLTDMPDSLLRGTQIEPGWFVVGLAAQLLILICLIGQALATRRRGRLVIPVSLIFVGLLATLLLVIYASVRHDLVFVVGGLLNMMIGFRVLEMVRKINQKHAQKDDTPFPDVRPDAADRTKRNEPIR